MFMQIIFIGHTLLSWLYLHYAASVLGLEGFNDYVHIDDTLGLGRQFDGIGAISGGGATSKLLVNYPDQQRNQILDILFKPKYAASLQILKVEIGGDSQSTDGSEASHMHTASDLNFNRGYEWWLMKEAKKRNSAIKLYGLPWVFPGWLGPGNGTITPYVSVDNLVNYTVNWIEGAQRVHNLTIDYIGIWNERPFNADYIKLLRRVLDRDGFSHVRIVAADGQWEILDALLQDPELLAAVDIIGMHYFNTNLPSEALLLDLPIWASEEYSAYNDEAGGGCWIRDLIEDHVVGMRTAFIAWNLVTSYYEGLPYTKSSLMTADQPWSGHFTVDTPVWMTAHFTHFVEIGWTYLRHGQGVGNFSGNGSYVTLTSPDRQHIAIIIETMNPSDVPCFYPMPQFTVKAQRVQFELRGSFVGIDKLSVWSSHLDFKRNKPTLFKRSHDITVSNGKFYFDVDVNSVYTLTTVEHVGQYFSINSPDPAPFPLPYKDNFDAYPQYSEPHNLAQQAGVFEVLETEDALHKNILRQTVPQPPLDTCRPDVFPWTINLIGNNTWKDMRVGFDFRVPRTGGSTGVFAAVRVASGGCDVMKAGGVYFWVFLNNQTYQLSGTFNNSVIYSQGIVPRVDYEEWNTLVLTTSGADAYGYLNNKLLAAVTMNTITSGAGFVGFGTGSFAAADFDNLLIDSVSSRKPYPLLFKSENSVLPHLLQP